MYNLSLDAKFHAESKKWGFEALLLVKKMSKMAKIPGEAFFVLHFSPPKKAI